MEMNLSNKTYVVTGATSGIGLATAENLVRQGAALIGVGRSAERCLAAEQHLRRINPAAQVTYRVADLSRQAEIHNLADEIGALLAARGCAALDGLVNNAGTFTYWLTLTPDGVEMQWAVNHLAPFLLTCRLMPLLSAAPAARVVTVSSDSHFGAKINWDDPQQRRHYNGLRAYGSTKLANILFTQALNRRLGSQSRVRAYAADPGLVKTDIGMKGTPAAAGWVWKLRRSGGIDPAEAAAGIVFLLTEPVISPAEAVYWKHGRPKPASRAALDPQTAERLWTLSEQLCGLPAEVNHAAA